MWTPPDRYGPWGNRQHKNPYSSLFSYEGPFGVGYLSAFIDFALEEKDPINESLITRYEQDMVRQHEERLKAEDTYLALARLTIDTWVEEGRKFSWKQYLDEAKDQKMQNRS